MRRILGVDLYRKQPGENLRIDQVEGWIVDQCTNTCGPLGEASNHRRRSMFGPQRTVQPCAIKYRVLNTGFCGTGLPCVNAAGSAEALGRRTKTGQVATTGPIPGGCRP